jgi:hypothetical protein
MQVSVKNIYAAVTIDVPLQELTGKCEELVKMRKDRDAAAASLSKEEASVKKLHADIASVQAEKVRKQYQTLVLMQVHLSGMVKLPMHPYAVQAADCRWCCRRPSKQRQLQKRRRLSGRVQKQQSSPSSLSAAILRQRWAS